MVNSPPSSLSSGDWSALHWAAYSGNWEMVKLLLSFNADVALVDR